MLENTMHRQSMVKNNKIIQHKILILFDLKYFLINFFITITLKF